MSLVAIALIVFNRFSKCSISFPRLHFDDTTLRTPDKTIDRWIAAIHD